MTFPEMTMRWRGFACLVAVAASAMLITGCGGGSASAPAASAGAPLVVTQPPTLTNSQALVVEVGPANGVNQLYTTVTICAPGSSTACATVDHVLVDTGSTGLRLFASTLPANLGLAAPAGVGGALHECIQFADGYSWGAIKSADIRLGGDTVRATPIHILGDASLPPVPASCSSSGPAENTVQAFGSNGVLGISNFAQDCGSACEQTAMTGSYYRCSGNVCTATSVATTLQMQHPVSLLAKDNNGVLLQLPAVGSEGAVSLAGSMIFGIGTQTNNGLGSARTFTVSATDGTLPINIGGTSYGASFLDSGSNAYFFPSSTTVCSSGFYCPPSTQSVSAVVQGRNGTSAAIGFNFANADNQFKTHPDFAVLPLLAGAPFGNAAVDLGLPFFYGRNVFTAIEGRTTPSGTGPFIAF